MNRQHLVQSRVAGPALALLLLSCRRDEPMAGGEPLSYWKHEAKQVSFFSFWNSTKDERRHEAFRRLAEIGEPAVPVLLDLMKDEGIPVSGDAFNVLANLGPRAHSAIPDVIELLDDDAIELRRRAAWLLGTIGPAAERAVPRLTQLLGSPDAQLRRTAAQALGQIGGAGRDALLAASRSSDARVREAAVGGFVAQPGTVSERRSNLKAGLSDADPAVRRRSLELLLTARPAEADSLVDLLVQSLNDANEGVRSDAGRVLTVYLQHGRASQYLLAAVLRGGDPGSRARAAWQLGNAASDGLPHVQAPNNDETIGALVTALGDSDQAVRVYAARALVFEKGSAHERALDAMRREVRTAPPVLAVRGARAFWLVTHDLAAVRPVYERGLEDPERWNRVETISAIMELGKDAALFRERFEALRNDPSPEVRDRAEKALYHLDLRR